MSVVPFTIPINRQELLENIHNNYTVKSLITPGELINKVEEAQQALYKEGPAFILDYFDTYYSVLHHTEHLRSDFIFKVYKQLTEATGKLNNSILLLLEDKDSLNDEIKLKTITVLKMLIYIYVQLILYLEDKKSNTHEDLLEKRKGKTAKKDENFAINKSKILNNLSNIIHREIYLFWDPPIVEHDFINQVAELCFAFLQNPAVKGDKTVVSEIFGILGVLVKSFDYGETFVTRIVRTVRRHEHAVGCIVKGVKMIVEQFNCTSIVHYLVKEATEWQMEDNHRDVQGTRCCATFLTELAVEIPELMLQEIEFMNKFLADKSIALRTTVLNIIKEVILQVLTSHDLNPKQKELRNELFKVIIEHIRDFSAVVRSKVIQIFTKLQKENAIPLIFQNEVLELIIKHLRDKVAAVRKSAVHCVTTFLEQNPYGANLQLKQVEGQLNEKRELLKSMEASYNEAHMAKLEPLEREWDGMKDELREVIRKQLKDPDEDEEEDDEDEEEQGEILETDQAVDKIRDFLAQKKFKEAVSLARNIKDNIKECKNVRFGNDEQEIQFYLEILHDFFINSVKILEELRAHVGMTPEDIEKIQAVENIIKYYERTVDFLKVIDAAIDPMKNLLLSPTIIDTHEAIEFFVTAYRFRIDRSSEGVLSMLKLMRSDEQERQNAVVDAFKEIYLTTDSNNMVDHTSIILNRLIGVLKDITYNNKGDFERIVVDWTAKGMLDNSVIERCWKFYTRRDDAVSWEDARAAAEILRMAATARVTIVRKNVAVVTEMLKQNKDDMLFLAASCRLLATAAGEKIDIQSEQEPFRIKWNDMIFQNVQKVLVKKFFEKEEYYTAGMEAALDFIFKVCSKPIAVASDIIKDIYQPLKANAKTTTLLLTRWCQLLGCMAIKVLGHLDNTVYRESKRRENVRDKNKKESKNKKNTKQQQRKTISSSPESEISLNESVLMGAAAEDTDAEFILSVLEDQIVTPVGLLGQFSPLIIKICRRPDLYKECCLQHAAVTALMRFMLVSSKFCRENIKLIFEILKGNSTSAELKCAILIHCSDLLTRFPNVVEPCTPFIYETLKDPNEEVRKTAFYSLSSLILKQMIRPHSHLHEMVACLIDPNREISGMCKGFLQKIAQKDETLVNSLPDIFTHLVQIQDITEEKLHEILEFLFSLLDSNKRMENLVDRFCSRYTPDENHHLNRNITFCLSLINYNEKALRKLREKFPTYQHHLHDAEIYSTLKQLLAECSKVKPGKPDLKPIVQEIQTCIDSVFEINENGEGTRPPSNVKSAKKKPSKRHPKKRAKKQVSSSEDEDSSEPTESTAKKTSRRRAS